VVKREPLKCDVKVPATTEGLSAIERCTAEGISINVTLLFSIERYPEVRRLSSRTGAAQPYCNRECKDCVSDIQRTLRLGEVSASRGARRPETVAALGSTSTKTKEYSDLKYVEALIGPETVNTMPLETLEAYRDHGAPEMRLMENIAGERDVLTELAALGIDIAAVTARLEEEGLNKFAEPFRKLMHSIEEKTHSLKRA
jgi:transaldolase